MSSLTAAAQHDFALGRLGNFLTRPFPHQRSPTHLRLSLIAAYSCSCKYFSLRTVSYLASFPNISAFPQVRSKQWQAYAALAADPVHGLMPT